MGRFYKTSKGQYLDFVYKQPRNMMLKAVQVADAQVAKNESKAADLYGRLKFNALSPDTKDRDNIIEGYKTEIDDLSEQIRNNPLDFRRDAPTIRALSDKIKDDMERGQIAAIESNYNTRQKYEEELTANEDVSAVEKKKLLANYDADFARIKDGDTKGGTVFKGTDDYRTYKKGYLSKNVDLYKLVDERGTGIKEMLESQAGWNVKERGDGKYIVTTSGGKEFVDPKRVQSLINNFLATDPNVKAAFGSRMREGIEGYDKESVGNLFKAASQYAIGKYAYTKDTKKVNATADGFAMAGYKRDLKNEQFVLERNQDDNNNPMLLGGTNSYSDKTDVDGNPIAGSETIANGLTDAYNTFAAGNLQEVKKQLLEANGLQILDGKVVDGMNQEIRTGKTRADNYKVGLDKLEKAFEEAKATGDFSKVKSAAKEAGVKLNNNQIDEFATNSWNSDTAVKLNKYNTKKGNIKNKFISDLRIKNPQLHASLEETGKLDVVADAHVKKTLDNPIYTNVATPVEEEQKIGFDNGQPSFSDNALQQKYLRYLETIGDKGSFDAMMGEGGTILIKGQAGEGGTSLPANFNQLVKEGIIAFEENKGGLEFTEHTDSNDNTKTVTSATMSIAGKPYQLVQGELYHTYSHVNGMNEGLKYKRRFTLTDPTTGKKLPMEISMLQPEENIPLPAEFRSLKDPSRYADESAKRKLTLAKDENSNAVRDGIINASDATTTVDGTNGELKAVYNDNGSSSFEYGGERVSTDVAVDIIKQYAELTLKGK